MKFKTKLLFFVLSIFLFSFSVVGSLDWDTAKRGDYYCIGGGISYHDFWGWQDFATCKGSGVDSICIEQDKFIQTVPICPVGYDCSSSSFKTSCERNNLYDDICTENNQQISSSNKFYCDLTCYTFSHGKVTSMQKSDIKCSDIGQFDEIPNMCGDGQVSDNEQCEGRDSISCVKLGSEYGFSAWVSGTANCKNCLWDDSSCNYNTVKSCESICKDENRHTNCGECVKDNWLHTSATYNYDILDSSVGGCPEDYICRIPKDLNIDEDIMESDIRTVPERLSDDIVKVYEYVKTTLGWGIAIIIILIVLFILAKIGLRLL